MQMAKKFYAQPGDALTAGWYYQIDLAVPVGPFPSEEAAEAAAQKSAAPILFVLTIQWRSWDRTIAVFRSREAVKARLDKIVREEYPDEDGDTDDFCEHGHSWWIDEVKVEE